MGGGCLGKSPQNMVGMGDNMDKVYEIFLVETFLKIINEVNEIIF